MTTHPSSCSGRSPWRQLDPPLPLTHHIPSGLRVLSASVHVSLRPCSPLSPGGFKLPSSLTWMFAVTSFGPLPLQVYSHHGSRSAPVKMQVQNFLWFLIWLRMEIKALTVAPKTHQGPVFFVCFVFFWSLPPVHRLCIDAISVRYVTLSPILGKPRWLSPDPKGLRIPPKLTN